MSLVAYPDIASLPEEVRTAIAHAPVQLNIFKMMANAETCFIPLTRLGGARGEAGGVCRATCQ